MNNPLSSSSSHQEPSSKWPYLPDHTFLTILKYLNGSDVASLTGTCKRWRNFFHIKEFWRDIIVVIRFKTFDRERIKFACSRVKICKKLTIKWLINADFLNSVSNLKNSVISCQTKTALTLLRSMKYSITELRLRFFDTRESFNLDFYLEASLILSEFIKNAKNIQVLSFGCNPFLMRKSITKHLNRSCLGNLTELNIASISHITWRSSRKKFEDMLDLNMDWQEVTDELIKRFIVSKCPFKYLVIYMQSHDCVNFNHPEKRHWFELEARKKTEITLTFWSGVHPDMICPASRNIYPVVCHKLIECSYVDSIYSLLLTSHRACLRKQIFCCLNKECVYLENGDELWESAMQCTKLESIVIIGHYLVPSSVREIANIFAAHLKNYIIADGCITKDNEENQLDNYGLISDEELANLKKDVSQKLRRKWEPIKKDNLPKEIDYFVDDNDEYLFGTVQDKKGILNI